MATRLDGGLSMATGDATTGGAEQNPQGPGEILVRLLACVERATDRAERVLPSVDHLVLRRAGLPPASVLGTLRRVGPAGLVEPFESWQRLLRDFDAAVVTLTEMNDGEGGDRSDYQDRLGGCITEARRCRLAVEEAAEDLRRRVAAMIDRALAHEQSRLTGSEADRHISQNPAGGAT